MPTDFQHSIVSPALTAVAAHWLLARRGCKMPAWTSLMPSAIKAQLPIVWSYSYDPVSDSFTGRLAGDRVAAIFGKNFHGLPMSEVHPRENYLDLFAKCKRVMTKPALYHGHGMILNIAGKPCVGERVIMPLSNDGITCDGVFGATEFPPFFPQGFPEINFDPEVEGWFLTSARTKIV